MSMYKTRSSTSLLSMWQVRSQIWSSLPMVRLTICFYLNYSISYASLKDKQLYFICKLQIFCVISWLGSDVLWLRCCDIIRIFHSFLAGKLKIDSFAFSLIAYRLTTWFFCFFLNGYRAWLIFRKYAWLNWNWKTNNVYALFYFYRTYQTQNQQVEDFIYFSFSSHQWCLLSVYRRYSSIIYF